MYDSFVIRRNQIEELAYLKSDDELRLEVKKRDSKTEAEKLKRKQQQKNMLKISDLSNKEEKLIYVLKKDIICERAN